MTPRGLDTLDDSLTIERARRGDIVAFRSLYEQHVQNVHALALRLMTEPSDAEELTQDVFVAAWRHLDEYEAKAKVSTWLHGITVRLARQLWRGILRRRRREDRVHPSYIHAIGQAMPDAEINLECALATLPRRMRTAVILHTIEGYTVKETAQLMKAAEGTVKAHLHHARLLLKERIKNNG